MHFRRRNRTKLHKEKKKKKGGLINSCDKKRRGKQMRKGKILPFESRVPKNSKEG